MHTNLKKYKFLKQIFFSKHSYSWRAEGVYIYKTIHLQVFITYLLDVINCFAISNLVSLLISDMENY